MSELIAVIRDFKGYGVKYNEYLTLKLNKQHWLTQENYCFFLGKKWSNKWVLVPKGYGTDGASVPPIATGILPVWGAHGPAVILHDWLCEYGYIWHMAEDGIPCKWMLTRDQIDEVFVEALRVIDASSFTIAAVRTAFAVHRKVSKPPVPNLDRYKQTLENQLRQETGQTLALGEKLWDYLGKQPGCPSRPQELVA